jgi:hypothetical protein
LGDWGLGIGDWEMGIVDCAQSPIPNPQSPIPNPQPLLLGKKINQKIKNLKSVFNPYNK